MKKLIWLMLFIGFFVSAYAQQKTVKKKESKKTIRTADKKQEIVVEQIKQDTSKAQVRKRQRGDILAGDSILILRPVDGKEFSSIELYTKSRFVDVPLKWDSITGEGFYEYYFTVGDFDAKPLSAEYSNTWVKIISIKSFRDRENNLVSVFFCKGKGENQVLWLMFEKAVLSGEVEVPRPQ